MTKELFYKQEIIIDAPVEDVWNALTNPEITKKYMFGCEAVTDWEPGSRLVWRGAADGVDYVVGNIINIDPYQMLEFTVFDPNGGLEDKPSNYINTRYELFAEGEKTILTLIQGDFAQADNGEKRFEDSKNGWKYAMETLKKAIE